MLTKSSASRPFAARQWFQVATLTGKEWAKRPRITSGGANRKLSETCRLLPLLGMAPLGDNHLTAVRTGRLAATCLAAHREQSGRLNLGREPAPAAMFRHCPRCDTIRVREVILKGSWPFQRNKTTRRRPMGAGHSQGGQRDPWPFADAAFSESPFVDQVTGRKPVRHAFAKSVPAHVVAGHLHVSTSGSCQRKAAGLGTPRMVVMEESR